MRKYDPPSWKSRPKTWHVESALFCRRAMSDNSSPGAGLADVPLNAAVAAKAQNTCMVRRSFMLKRMRKTASAVYMYELWLFKGTFAMVETWPDILWIIGSPKGVRVKKC